MHAPIVPSGRTLALLALFAPLAVVIAAVAPAAWLAAPGIALALVVMALADGLLAPPLRDLKLHAPADAEVGQPVTLTVLAEFQATPARLPEAAIGFDPRLGKHGAVRFPLDRQDTPAVSSGEAQIVPLRRGTGSIHELWLRWPGPLGLASRQAHRRFDHAVPEGLLAIRPVRERARDHRVVYREEW